MLCSAGLKPPTKASCIQPSKERGGRPQRIGDNTGYLSISRNPDAIFCCLRPLLRYWRSFECDVLVAKSRLLTGVPYDWKFQPGCTTVPIGSPLPESTPRVVFQKNTHDSFGFSGIVFTPNTRVRESTAAGRPENKTKTSI